MKKSLWIKIITKITPELQCWELNSLSLLFCKNDLKKKKYKFYKKKVPFYLVWNIKRSEKIKRKKKNCKTRNLRATKKERWEKWSETWNFWFAHEKFWLRCSELFAVIWRLKWALIVEPPTAGNQSTKREMRLPRLSLKAMIITSVYGRLSVDTWTAFQRPFSLVTGRPVFKGWLDSFLRPKFCQVHSGPIRENKLSSMDWLFIDLIKIKCDRQDDYIYNPRQKSWLASWPTSKGAKKRNKTSMAVHVRK